MPLHFQVNMNYGDWLEWNSTTPKDVISTAWFAYDAHLMQKMARAIGNLEDAKFYRELHKNISLAFNTAFVDQKTALIKGDTQTAYILALQMEVLPKTLRPMAAKHLVRKVKDHNLHLSTGFIGTGFLTNVLTAWNFTDVAYSLLLQDSLPSWLYE